MREEVDVVRVSTDRGHWGLKGGLEDVGEVGRASERGKATVDVEPDGCEGPSVLRGESQEGKRNDRAGSSSTAGFVALSPEGDSSGRENPEMTLATETRL